jgi:hypothetical protein
VVNPVDSRIITLGAGPGRVGWPFSDYNLAHKSPYFASRGLSGCLLTERVQ